MGYAPLRDSRSRLETDPIRNFKFIVKFMAGVDASSNGPTTPPVDGTRGNAGPTATLGFMSVAGLSVATEPIPYREGGDNTTPRKLPGQSNFSDITLTRGVVIGSSRNWKWFQRIFHALQGRGLATYSSNVGGADTSPFFRFDTEIHVLDHPTNSPVGTSPSKLRFKVYNCWPSSLAYSDLDAGGNAVLIEQMTLTHEGWEMRWAPKIGAVIGKSFNQHSAE
jgi:phage tail-like protein